ncbi:hypothetical protein TrVFT333_009204 [Trichoderma virens FT-333]|nr:hypothetical protein TrVFT333_009204 [Trichoderma virens FT-333]
MVNFPPELMLKILGDKQIKKPDLKNLRLVSKWMSIFATHFLFSRIYISKLNYDSEIFFNIAAQPHLAMAVQTLTWLEMVEDEISLTDAEHIRDGPRNTEVDLSSLLDHFDRISRWRPSDEPHVYDSWLPEMQSTSREDDTQREDSIQTFTPRFFAALDKMPKLKELISQPMPIARELTTPSGQPPSQYPFTGQLFLQGTPDAWGSRNDGFYTLMIPYLTHRANLHTLTPITRLHLVDESIWLYLRRLAGSFAKCLENLTHINLCISNIRNLEELDCAGSYLKVATALEEIILCLNRSGVHQKRTRNFFGLFFPSDCQYPKLHTLKLANVPFTHRSLLEFVTKVASSLKDLTFHNCHVTIRTIHALSKIPELELKRCVSTTIQVKIDSLEEVILSEEKLLNILNKTNRSFFHVYSTKDRGCRIYTHSSESLAQKMWMFDDYHHNLYQDGTDCFPLLEWYESDNENYERLDEEYDGGGDVDIEEDEDSDEIPMMTQMWDMM